MKSYCRRQVDLLYERLNSERHFLQVLAGPRQTGKTTILMQTLQRFPDNSLYCVTEGVALPAAAWLEQQWETARLRLSRLPKKRAFVLAIDEIQNIPGWSTAVKQLWDEDTRQGNDIRVVLTGSAPLLMQQGLTESLAGRFELLRVSHWSFSEMRDAFGFSVPQYIYFGGYPGAAHLTGDESRWRAYVRDALIETTISRDILMLTRVDKPALLKRLFELGCHYSGQELSFTKLLGQLQDAGNTVTLSHYLDLLAGAGMLMGLQKYAAGQVRRRASSPKFQVMNTALLGVLAPVSFQDLDQVPDFRGRLYESAVGAHLCSQAAGSGIEVYYWREGNREVDFVLTQGRKVTVIEVKSGRKKGALPGIAAFSKAFPRARKLLVGKGGISFKEILETEVEQLL